MNQQQDNLSEDSNDFSEEERAAVYRTIFSRRDVRGDFLNNPIPDDVLTRVLQAAHHAPSVGFMQPWDFMLISSKEKRQGVHDLFLEANEEAAQMFDGDRQQLYRSLKLEGILDSPLNICITCDRERTGPVVIGRTHMREMDLYSTVCAVQNLWLAARSEGLGVGWVSILHKQALRHLLGIPENIEVVAYLCIGYVSHFRDRPELEQAGWLPRRPLEELIHYDGWDIRKKPGQN